MAQFIEIKDVVFSYLNQETGDAVNALDHVTLSIPKGSFTAILGRNGSGKSTLAKMINGLLLPSKGQVLVDGIDTTDEESIWGIRQKVAMVFQNPDNQLVAAIVEDDVAFGPENLGIPSEEIQRRVADALAAVNMGEYRGKAPHMLSGGQKQRIAIAGAVAMRPECIIFDEPTAMLDPAGRRAVLEIIHRLHKEGITCVLITHYMEEAAQAQQVVVMEKGTIRLQGSPADVFKEKEKLLQLGMQLPLAVELAEELRLRGIDLPDNIVEEEQLVEAICHWK